MSEETRTDAREHGTGPLSRIASSIFSLLQIRLELFGIELTEERERLLGVLFLGLIALMFASMALVALTALIAIAFWDTYRWQALAAITAVYALAALACAWRARHGLRRAPFPFQATLDEFEKDRKLFHHD